MRKNKVFQIRIKTIMPTPLLLLAIMAMVWCFAAGPVFASGLKKGDIVFASNMKDEWNIWVVEPQTHYSRQLTSTTETERYPSVSLDGEKIAYVSGRKQIWVMDSLTGKKESVHLPIGIYAQPTWAPSGNELAYVEYTALPADTGEIFNVKKANGFWQLPKKITKFPPMMTFPAYSPDGKRLACSSFARDSLLGVIEEIFVVDMETGYKQQLTHDKADSFFPAWSPDGSRLAYSSNLEGNFDIWIVTYPEGVKTRVTKNLSYDGEPSWSPDGNRIAFVSSRSGHREIWTVDLNGQDARQVTDFKKTCSHPCWVK